ncbi:pentraxin fusion protein [Hippoglossus stenolepis]|uniref:pentraxin fusion protein n=1 Tax=Hippoglossus stenolepis TaxID=195615 RepID=UPI001FAF77E4|nr:pentraxin fusion protein [Hippoglossus stenolepis]
MRLLVVSFLVAISAVLAGSVVIKTMVFQTESSNSFVEMLPMKPLNLRAFTLCMRVATELKGEREVILFAYRTRDYDELNVWRELDGRYTTVNTNANTYDTANLHFQPKIYKKGHTIRPGGKVIIGQDPDAYMGNYDAKQSFVGEISDVNLWDTVLPASTIQDIYTGKRVARGNVFDWETTDLKINGEVDVVTREL